MSPQEVLSRFFGLDDAGRWSFVMKDGRRCEGYALEVEGDRVCFGFGGPLAPEEPEWLLFDSIDMAGNHYWSERERRWKEFTT